MRVPEDESDGELADLLELKPKRPSPPTHEHPRERMLMFGSAALADVELLALLLRGERAIQRAQTVLDHVGGLLGLAGACPQELIGVGDLDEDDATALVAAVELKRRIERLDLPWSARLVSSRATESFIRSFLGGSKQEHFLVLGLDVRHRVRMTRTVGTGTLARVEVHPRDVFRALISAGMHSCIIVHNHPSGDHEPSSGDIDLTHRMIEIGQLLGIPVVDHVIISDRGFVSLAEAGLISVDKFEIFTVS